MKYRHLLTFRCEEKAPSLGASYRFGWSSISADSDGRNLNNEALVQVMDILRTDRAEKFECEPAAINLFLVNHTVVLL